MGSKKTKLKVLVLSQVITITVTEWTLSVAFCLHDFIARYSERTFQHMDTNTVKQINSTS